MYRKKIMLASCLALTTSLAHSATFVIQKYGENHSIDGNNGAIEGQQVYLWETDSENENQQWLQISHGDGYYAYQKQNTNLCWDGGNNGANGQALTLQECDSSDYNQHWAKIEISTDVYRIEKRNATGWSIDGNYDASNRQMIYLWGSNDSNINQQWEFINVGEDDIALDIESVFDDATSHNSYPATNVIDGDTSFSSRWAASGSAVNLTMQLQEVAEVTEVGIAWGAGEERTHTFEIYARADSSDAWTKVFEGVSSGTSEALEYFDIADIDALQVRIMVSENSAGTKWTNITEVALKGVNIDAVTTIAEGPGNSWTYCASEREECEFSDVKALAYGAGDDWSYSVEVDGLTCNNTNLEDIASGQTKSCWIRNTTYEYIVVSNIDELKAAMSNSDQRIRMRRGTYVADELIPDENMVFEFDGDNNYLDMTGVTLQVPTALLNSMSTTPVHSHVTYQIIGDDNIIVNGTFENTYPNGQHDVSDFGEHNSDDHNDYWPARQMTEFKIYGDNNELRDNTIIIRGSYPYGYGDMFGKGSGSVVYLRKHAAINVIGDNTIIDGLDLTVLAFGHGIFMQGADNTIIRNTRVEGALRLGADMYNDGADSLPAQWSYQQQSPDWYIGLPIVENRMYNLTEDGIRTYGSGTKYDGTVVNTGSVFVENTTVDKMRNCFALVTASHAELDNVEVTRCGENGYSLPSNGIVSNSRGDWAYAPLIQMPYGNENNITMDITVLAPEHTTGDFYLTDIAGSDHNIILRSDGNSVVGSNSMAVGHAWDRWNYDSSNLYRHGASDINIQNETGYPMVLTEYSSNITVTSEGQVTDQGEDNSVK